MEWTPDFYDLFQINFNSISLFDNKIYKGYKLIIDDDIKCEEELDNNIDYNYYIDEFYIKKPDGTKVKINTTNVDRLYFDKDFYDYTLSLYPEDKSSSESYYAELDMVKLMDFQSLFVVEIKNNELSATMDKIKKLIDNKSVITLYDRNSILKEFITTNIQGNITLNSVHFEVLLMNQIIAADDELENPDWTVKDQGYQILTLSKALSNNPSITVRLEAAKVAKTLANPQNSRLWRPSMSDIYFMEQPQEYLDEEFISDEYRPKSEVEKGNIVIPFTFDNPKIKVGRGNKKK
jgi:hypothetical protein